MKSEKNKIKPSCDEAYKGNKITTKPLLDSTF